MGRKLFVVSDIHGHYTELMKALDDAGFDKENKDHVFVSCGDLFDRGTENIRVYDFIKGLSQKILIKGNHEDMLCELFERGSVMYENRTNGTDITVREFLGNDSIDENGCIDRELHADKIREVRDFIDSMLNYYESGDYVFTHGWLPVEFNGRLPSVSPSWKNASIADWEYARWLEWQQLYEVGAMLEGKTIVCGHRPSHLASMFDYFWDHNCCDPFYTKGMIAIDADTVNSERVNVIVIEE